MKQQAAETILETGIRAHRQTNRVSNPAYIASLGEHFSPHPPCFRTADTPRPVPVLWAAPQSVVALALHHLARNRFTLRVAASGF